MKTFLCALACTIVGICTPGPAITTPEDEQWRKWLVGPWTYRNKKRKKNHPFDHIERHRTRIIIVELNHQTHPFQTLDLTTSSQESIPRARSGSMFFKPNTIGLKFPAKLKGPKFGRQTKW